MYIITHIRSVCLLVFLVYHCVQCCYYSLLFIWFTFTWYSLCVLYVGWLLIFGPKWGRRDADISLSGVVGSCVGCCGSLVLVVPEVYVPRIWSSHMWMYMLYRLDVYTCVGRVGIVCRWPVKVI